MLRFLRFASTVAPIRSASIQEHVDYPIRRALELRKTKSAGFLLRDAVSSVISCLESSTPLSPPSASPTSSASTKPRIVFDGEPGVGKSVALMQVTDWALSNNQVLLTVPSAYILANHGAFIIPMDGGRYGQTDVAQNLLRRFKESYGERLQDVGLSREYSLVRKRAGEDVATNVSSVRQLLEFGISQRDSAPLGWDVLMKELPFLVERGVPITILVDGIDSLLANTSHVGTDSKKLHASQLSVPSSLYEVMKSGTVPTIASTSTSRPHGNWSGIRDELFFGKKFGGEALFERVVLPEWSLDESSAFIKMLQEDGFLQTQNVDVKRLHFLAGGRPKELFKFLGGDFLKRLPSVQ
ncbi:mitochondrial ribosomal protein S29 (mS29/DAP3) [Andalucia godoyi]|uniref:Small ribosomal subunit protein mS29 n=1 Tax=Andalucia godoyi TaxID=505711 RepID=A0A8K0F2Z8_ANDGO|nr:mitochondrial ribosomal protein S29 (mS29/DAP3) [Andalucia godoyi]|eukprot:ANDGO_05980.mRNA.1 mitochondrial ribosomal protein S29 (mS29/DAP3)